MKKRLGKLLVSKGEAAHLLSISEKKLWNITCPRGPVPVVRLGSRILYSVKSLRGFVQEQEKNLQENVFDTEC